MADAEGPKIIVDSDWKSQAQAEKERLAAQEKAAAPRPGMPGAEGEAGGLPQASFEELVRILATQALLYLGAFPDPETGRAVVSPELARLNIDLLGILEAKTKNNLTEDESRMLAQVLYELRMQFVEVSKAIARAVEQGRLSPAAGAAGGVAPVQAPPPHTGT